jgi:hypothetical protein
MNTLLELLYNPPGVIWPMVLFAVLLFALHQVKEQINPLITGVVTGLAQHAQANSAAYGMAVMFGLSASLAAFYDVFSQVDTSTMKGMSWWQFGALLAKVLNPFVVAVLAYATKITPAKTSTATTPPFPPQP